MGLIALVDNRPTDKNIKKQNDIICVKLDHSDWSDLEKAYFLRIAIEDEVLEAELQAKYDAGEPHPVAVYPYAQYDEVLNSGSESESSDGLSSPVMTTRSKYRFRRDLMSVATLGLLGTTESAMNDRETETPVLRKKKTAEQPGNPFNLTDMTEDESSSSS